MTHAQQAEYLTANGWTRKGELWFCRGVGYAWELSAAVDQQKYLDRIAEEDGKCTTGSGPIKNGPNKSRKTNTARTSTA